MTNTLIDECSGLIYSIASKYSNYNMEDLYQAGCVGVMKAFKSFKGELNVKFSTYAYNFILGEIVDFIKKDRNIKISDEYFNIYKSYLKTKEFLTQRNQSSPSFEDICSFMQIDQASLINIIESTLYTKNVDSIIEPTENYVNNDLIDKLLLDSEIEKLNEPEKSIIRYRYYFDMSQEETAKMINISQSKVSRCETKALKLIKSRLVK